MDCGTGTSIELVIRERKTHHCFWMLRPIVGTFYVHAMASSIVQFRQLYKAGDLIINKRKPPKAVVIGKKIMEESDLILMVG